MCKVKGSALSVQGRYLSEKITKQSIYFCKYKVVLRLLLTTYPQNFIFLNNRWSQKNGSPFVKNILLKFALTIISAPYQPLLSTSCPGETWEIFTASFLMRCLGLRGKINCKTWSHCKVGSKTILRIGQRSVIGWLGCDISILS